MLSSGPVRRDGLFWDFGSLYQGQVPHVAMSRSQFCSSLRERLCSGTSGRLVRDAAASSTPAVAAACAEQRLFYSSPWFWFPLFLPNVSLLRPAVQVVTTETVRSALALTISSTGNFNISILDHMKKLNYIAFVGAVLRFSFMMSVSAENREGSGPARLQGRRLSSVSQQTQPSRQSGVVEAPQIQS